MSKVEDTGIDESFARTYDPIVTLAPVDLESGEEGEELIHKVYCFCHDLSVFSRPFVFIDTLFFPPLRRAMLFRHDSTSTPPEWFVACLCYSHSLPILILFLGRNVGLVR
jgi:hypothetical protein